MFGRRLIRVRQRLNYLILFPMESGSSCARWLASVCFAEMSRMFQNHTYIGLVDYDLSLSVVQHETKMFMINHAAIAYGLSPPPPCSSQAARSVDACSILTLLDPSSHGHLAKSSSTNSASSNSEPMAESDSSLRPRSSRSSTSPSNTRRRFQRFKRRSKRTSVPSSPHPPCPFPRLFFKADAFR
jgi:hypothetical protein